MPECLQSVPSFFAFAERWANDGAKMTWAPWMQTKTPASYRRMGRIYIFLAAVIAVAAIIRLFHIAAQR